MFSKKTPTIADQDNESSEHQDDAFSSADNEHESAIDNQSANQGDLTSPAKRATKPTIISEGFEFVGNITSDGTLNIAGVVKGKISAKSILVDAEGQVEGDLTSEILVVKGRVVGEVACQDLNVGPRAFIDGSISYQNIHIQRGGRVAGKFNKN
jgi:cytoskeletal protein CcmA (bactofilin family)